MPTFAQIRACFAVGYFSRPFPEMPTRRHTGRDVGAVWLGTVGTIKTIFQAPPIYRTHRTYRPSLRIVDGWFVLNMDVADVVAFFGLIRHAEFL